MILDFHFMYRCYNMTYNPVFLYVHTYVKVYVNESKGENNYHH